MAETPQNPPSQPVWRKIVRYVGDWLSAAPSFLRAALKTRTGKSLAVAGIAALLRLIPWANGVTTAQVAEVLDWILYLTGTGATVYGTLYANEGLKDLNRLQRPERYTLDPSLEWTKYVSRAVDGTVVLEVSAYEMRDGVLYAVTQNGLIPAQGPSELLAIIRTLIATQMGQTR